MGVAAWPSRVCTQNRKERTMAGQFSQMARHSLPADAYQEYLKGLGEEWVDRMDQLASQWDKLYGRLAWGSRAFKQTPADPEGVTIRPLAGDRFDGKVSPLLPPEADSERFLKRLGQEWLDWMIEVDLELEKLEEVRDRVFHEAKGDGRGQAAASKPPSDSVAE